MEDDEDGNAGDAPECVSTRQYYTGRRTSSQPTLPAQALSVTTVQIIGFPHTNRALPVSPWFRRLSVAEPEGRSHNALMAGFSPDSGHY